ncbi:hypothetical protein [Litoribacter populi]|uniref:hypothetical protein n=1 Tax=Litoribacter populi TaxID=2598460 RepID=UPI00117F5E14|nr:hypothetical protein [Litoribacter populi]
MDNRAIIFTVLGILVGAVGGYLYYRFVGCDQGCAITGRPWSSAIYGSILGGMLGQHFGR